MLYLYLITRLEIEDFGLLKEKGVFTFFSL